MRKGLFSAHLPESSSGFVISIIKYVFIRTRERQRHRWENQRQSNNLFVLFMSTECAWNIFIRYFNAPANKWPTWKKNQRNNNLFILYYDVRLHLFCTRIRCAIEILLDQPEQSRFWWKNCAKRSIFDIHYVCDGFGLYQSIKLNRFFSLFSEFET